MAMALYVAMWMDLDRPYWALVSAVFLQVRPESGMVLEKAVCQILGTLTGGIFALLILNLFNAYPEMALASLGLWVWLNSSLSSMVRRINFIYFFAMACVTPCIIILLTMAQPAFVSSETIFSIAQSRMSEIIVGAVCAMMVSILLWPQRVEDGLKQHARNAINQTMTYLNLELSLDGSHEGRHKHIDDILVTLTTLNDDSSAVVFEGPQGPGQSRAATLICNKILSLVSVIQVFGRLQRDYPELLSDVLKHLLTQLREDLSTIVRSDNYEECYQIAQSQRRRWRHFYQTENLSPLETRLGQTAQEMVGDIVLILRAYNALVRGEQSVLKTPSIKPYRDPLVGLTTGFRTFLVFTIGAVLWVGTGSSAAIMLMILPVIFSIMFARLAPMLVKHALFRILLGVCVAIPTAIFYGLNLIAQSTGDFELLAMIIAVPFFLGLMAIANRPLLPYGLGLCIPFVILVRPANDMTMSFAMDYTVSSALAIATGVSVLYWVFRLFTGPGPERMQYRLLSATRRDLKRIAARQHGREWFNARMCDRLLRLTTYDQGLHAKTRIVTDLGLTGLNLGHVSLRLRNLVNSVSEQPMTKQLAVWQDALADAFYEAASGQQSEQLKPACDDLLSALKAQDVAREHVAVVEGIFERLTMTFHRTATMISDSRH